MTETLKGPALIAEGLTKRFGRGVWALHDVSLEVNWGRITALVGPNAAGKSTLIKTWVGFERPTQGRVLVGGVDPWNDRAKSIALMAYLPQVPALYPELTAAEHIELAHHYRPSLERGEALMRLRKLTVPLDRPARALSGGQSAQLGLAIALATHSPILLLDEPMASLDPLARREFIDALKEGVTESGASAVLSSHVVGDIEQVADWLVVLGVGRKLLDMSLVEATSLHRVADGHDQLVPDEQVIAQLPGMRGALIRTDSGSGPGRIASLEDVVMGYLSRDRSTIDPDLRDRLPT